jgi:kinesin family member C1
MSRLPAPSSHVGLTECSDSQHNARIQSSIPALPSASKGLKREIPQPGTYLPAPDRSLSSSSRLLTLPSLPSLAVQSEAKRKPLAERAAEFPAKSSSVAPATRSSIKGQTLASISSQVSCCLLLPCAFLASVRCIHRPNLRSSFPSGYSGICTVE